MATYDESYRNLIAKLVTLRDTLQIDLAQIEALSPNPDPVFHSANVQRLEELMAQTQRSIKSLASMLGRAKMREAAILRSVTGGKKPRVTVLS